MSVTGRTTRRVRILVAAIALPVIALVGAIALWSFSSGGSGPAHVHSESSALTEAAASAPEADRTRSLERTPSDDPIPLEPPADSPVGSEPETSLAQAAGADPGSPARAGSGSLGSPRAPVSAEEVIGSEALGGCHPDYGDAGQCLPVIPPSLAEHAQAMADAGIDPASMVHPWSCPELRSLFPSGIAVRSGQDPLGLDSDADGVACGPDDRTD